MEKTKIFWETFTREQLLEVKIKDLNLHRLKTPDSIRSCQKQLHKELRGKGLRFRPHFWISDEWFCPDGISGIAIPFYLFHPKLKRLEKTMMGRVEGETQSDMMKILRHEAGHAIDNAYMLRKLKTRQKLFGPSSRTYPISYKPNPLRGNFVQNLGDYYAQAHPDEDWAETFAVWLNPSSHWEKRYQSSKALEKLLLLDKIMERLKGQQAGVFEKETYHSFDKIEMSLSEYYKKKIKHYKIQDKREVLKKIASKVFVEEKSSKSKNASAFIRKCKKEADFDCRDYPIKSFLDELESFCAKEGFNLRDSEQKTIHSFESIIKRNKGLIVKGFSRVRL